MQANSLWFRLLASSAAISCLLLLAAGLLLNAIFVRALQRDFDGRLRSAHDALLANVEITPEGALHMQAQLPEARFSLPLSGWYWQVKDVGSPAVGLASPSLLEQTLPDPPEGAAPDALEGFNATDKAGNNLRVVAENVHFAGSDKTYAIKVAGNFDELKSEIQAFRNTLNAVLLALGAALLLALVLQVRFGLRPLRLLREELARIRNGQAEFLGGRYPEEIQPLAQELNGLIEHNSEVVERSRMQVGNLAHALKTPISILNNEAHGDASPLAAHVSEQVAVIREQVNLYLDRARRAARVKGAGASTDVAPVVDSIARTLHRLNRDRTLDIEVETEAGLKFRGEKQDFEEMLGNLMDNASKWAKAKVRVRSMKMNALEGNRATLLIEVEDDGPGIPATRRDEALKRGQRLDESKPGSGLGLSIIGETAAMYGGTFSLDESALGGLKARLKLPLVV